MRRLVGYKLTFRDRCPLPARRQTRPYNIGTEVGLFRTGAAASEHLGKELTELERARGRVVEGAKVVAVSRFDVSDVGDEAQGVNLTLESSGIAFYGTGVVFRRGRA